MRQLTSCPEILMVVQKSTKNELVFVADLGGTHLRAAIIDSTGVIRYQIKVSTPHTDKPNEIVRALVNAAKECEQQAREFGWQLRWKANWNGGRIWRTMRIRQRSVRCGKGLRAVTPQSFASRSAPVWA